MIRRLLSIFAVLALSVTAALAQSATTVQQSASDLRSATAIGTSATSAATITVTPGAGLYVYVTSVDIQNCAGASAVTAAAVTTITTTNLTGSPAYTVGSGVAAGLCQPTQILAYGPAGLKSTTPGTAVTYVLPTFATNQTVRVNVAYYTAP